ncbi:MAG: hypothetical protein ACKO23_16800, partial [Gemmataceae bacterium]
GFVFMANVFSLHEGEIMSFADTFFRKPPPLLQNLQHLNHQLRDLTNQLKHDIAVAVGETVASTVKSFLRRLLDASEPVRPALPKREAYLDRDVPFRDSEFPAHTWSKDPDAWFHDVEDEPIETPPPTTPSSPPSFMKKALATGVQAGLWWLRQQPRRRPILSTLAVAALAGSGTLLAGPTLGAGLAVMGSMAGMIVSSSAASLLGEQLLNLFRF